MDAKIESVKGFMAAYIGIFAVIIGDSYKHILVLLLLMSVDTVIGWVKGFKLKKWKSNKARWGAVGKFVELMIIACLYGLDWVFETDVLKYIGIYYFGICEIASIFENFAEMGGNIPDGTVELLKEVQYSIGTQSVKKIKDAFEKVWGSDKNADDKSERK